MLAQINTRRVQGQRTLCLGVLRQGKWTLPNLREEAVAWGGPNNVVMRRSSKKPTWGGFNVFQIVRSGGVYQALYWDQPKQGPAGALLATSRDGRK